MSEWWVTVPGIYKTWDRRMVMMFIITAVGDKEQKLKGPYLLKIRENNEKIQLCAQLPNYHSIKHIYQK